MLIYALIISVVLILIILTFSSRRLSPIPYFPSQRVDLPLIIKSLDLKNNQIIFDLGSGDGTVIFAAAKEAYKKKFKTKFIAVEINPILILILQLRRFLHTNKKNIKIVRADMFEVNLSLMSFWGVPIQSGRLQNRSSKQRFRTSRNDNEITRPLTPERSDGERVKQFSNIKIYLYISPWFLDQIAKKIFQEFPKAKIVSYMYSIKSLKNNERAIRGKNSIFIYG